MKDWAKIREEWREEAKQWAERRNPQGCTCDNEMFCQLCDDERRYMECMEDHADVIGSEYDECPF